MHISEGGNCAAASPNQRLARDAEASLLSGACSGRGLLTPTMPWKPKGPNRKVHLTARFTVEP